MSQILELVVERAVPGGRMLARHDGRVVLVAGAIPGERVRACVERIARHTVWARVAGPDDVLEPSPDRREPPVEPACGGAVMAHIANARQLQLKGEIIADAFRRVGRLPLESVPVVAGSDARGYRMRARLHVRRDRIGFFREGTHTICDAAATGQLLPESVRAAAEVVSRMSEQAHNCQAVVISENAAATERVVHIEAREGANLEPAFDALAGIDLPAVKLTGITALERDDLLEIAGNALVTDTTRTLAPRAHAIPPVSWGRRPTSFFQGNRHLIGDLVDRVLGHAEGQRCVDLYAGVGLFSIPLAALGRDVTAVEGDASSFEDLEVNAEPWRASLSIDRASVESWLSRQSERPDVVIGDPPRTGMAESAINELVRLRPPRIVYVSCDAPTLARDAARLVAANYRLQSIEGFDLFPNTAHVETVAVFSM